MVNLVERLVSVYLVGGKHAIRYKSSWRSLCCIVIEVASFLRPSIPCITSLCHCGLFATIVAARVCATVMLNGFTESQ